MLRELMRLRANNERLRFQVRDADRRAHEAEPVLADFVEKLQSLPRNHPDRPHLTRMIIDLSRELERAD
jgi:hypothetical protein